MGLAPALRVFVRTVERGSISAAARDLSVSQPAVSKHLRNLESHVGARLLERSARLARPTPTGQTLYEGARDGLATIEAALEGVRRDMGAVEGHLRVHAPTCIDGKQLHPIVLAFQQRHPGVTVDLALEDRVVDLVYENFDLALRLGRPDGAGLIVRPIGVTRRILVAAPDLLARTGPIETPERLMEVPVVVPISTAPDSTLALSRAGTDIAVPVRSVLRSNNPDVLVRTLVSAHAVGPVQQLLISQELSDGRLVCILPEYEARSSEVYFTFLSVRFMRSLVRAFTDFSVAALRQVEGIGAVGSTSVGPGTGRLRVPETTDWTVAFAGVAGD
ncbi:LysR family transcriptional regulator [Acuticoccus sediminis]|uniref:LysR family transcriptional regulator n=1 Tax=Acuticoccus sediminis TaxID=2184697 RepID=A0A8B2NXU0_9HYPH|nr:LysR family transcriptional regulator [Acuticoccus sediminis]RAI03510.1 LysR family transcriptional regulator [Acuticoccus sediminis]